MTNHGEIYENQIAERVNYLLIKALNYAKYLNLEQMQY